jgi:hypothetical protein
LRPPVQYHSFFGQGHFHHLLRRRGKLPHIPYPDALEMIEKKELFANPVPKRVSALRLTIFIFIPLQMLRYGHRLGGA